MIWQMNFAFLNRKSSTSPCCGKYPAFDPKKVIPTYPAYAHSGNAYISREGILLDADLKYSAKFSLIGRLQGDYRCSAQGMLHVILPRLNARTEESPPTVPILERGWESRGPARAGTRNGRQPHQQRRRCAIRMTAHASREAS